MPGRAYNISVQTVSRDVVSQPTDAQYRTGESVMSVNTDGVQTQRQRNSLFGTTKGDCRPGTPPGHLHIVASHSLNCNRSSNHGKAFRLGTGSELYREEAVFHVEPATSGHRLDFAGQKWDGFLAVSETCGSHSQRTSTAG